MGKFFRRISERYLTWGEILFFSRILKVLGIRKERKENSFLPSWEMEEFFMSFSILRRS